MRVSFCAVAIVDGMYDNQGVQWSYFNHGNHLEDDDDITLQKD